MEPSLWWDEHHFLAAARVCMIKPIHPTQTELSRSCLRLPEGPALVTVAVGAPQWAAGGDTEWLAGDRQTEAGWSQMSNPSWLSREGSRLA